uniref:Uncharacterized protein n=1 Tax=Arundo donax TaxID=35708 RepID=A0A0A9ABU4_ARUDO
MLHVKYFILRKEPLVGCN